MKTKLVRTFVLFLAGAAIGWTQGQTATTDTIKAALSAAVSDPASRAYALCQLQAAIWGNYGVRVFMPQSSASGHQALIFQITGGIFSQTVNTNPSPADIPTVSKDGTLFLPNRDAAFTQGVPFWIGDITFTGPTAFRYTVYSNPSVSVAGAFDFFEWIETTPTVKITSTVRSLPLSSSAQPQTFQAIFNPLNPADGKPAEEHSLYAGTESILLFTCPLSNQVDLLAASVSTPTIRRHLPVLQVFDNGATISSGTWIAIYGDKLSTTTRPWSLGDFQGTRAPTALDGVSAKVNGKPAFVSYVSPNQVNVQVPDDDTLGSVTVEVTGANGTSNQMNVQKTPASPALLTSPSFLVDGKQYLAALFPDNVTFAGRENLIPGVPFRPAKPGDIITVYAVGCGPSIPVTPAGEVLAQARLLALPYSFSFGPTPAQAQGFMAAQSVGLCAFNVTVPNVPDGDVPVSVSVGGNPTGQALYTTVHR